jgi:hypothetical protein
MTAALYYLLVQRTGFVFYNLRSSLNNSSLTFIGAFRWVLVAPILAVWLTVARVLHWDAFTAFTLELSFCTFSLLAHCNKKERGMEQMRNKFFNGDLIIQMTEHACHNFN